MRTGKGSQEEEQYEEEEFGSRKQETSSNQTMSLNAINNSTNSDGKNRDKANAIRSKHSVTEQRRRSKINERFQLLRNLIPNPDQKRDTASFLLEVIEYVQDLQDKVKKYEGSYQEWNSEPIKLVPWRNSHWHVQSFVGQQQAIKNGSGPGSAFAGKFDEINSNMNPTITTSEQNPLESDPVRDTTSKAMDQQPEFASRGMPLPVQGNNMPVHPLQRPVSEAQPTECFISNDTVNQHEDLTIEGGTISISSVYSEGLLNSLTQALQSAGLDLSEANISVQIDLRKHANRELASGTSAKDPQNHPIQAMTHLRDAINGAEPDHVQKRMKK
ncbi:Transcription factor BIM2 [Hibiscus syriacus]|uniref:Transcription factor BIM2 n=1 Tax=Hibiscus syriacus TaxID=106335 RepID=A0A6A3CY81_HIBSY|nr:transcription factor BIM2-like [Hibiscus syriacus]KAE8732049.1 Transcription factor BIM2 [Hibiscus syriacus]